MHFSTVLDFWFDTLSAKDWFSKSDELDAAIAEHFADIHRAAAAGELYSWRHSHEGRLAEILVLDQFSRNLFRDSPQAFAQDGQALVLAQEAIRHGADRALSDDQRAFLYMPYMHSESLAIQRASVLLYQALGRENNLDFARRHYAIIERFGRYPHRNAILGRESSDEEREFLAQPGSSF